MVFIRPIDVPSGPEAGPPISKGLTLFFCERLISDPWTAVSSPLFQESFGFPITSRSVLARFLAPEHHVSVPEKGIEVILLVLAASPFGLLRKLATFAKPSFAARTQALW
jgi:hypothetical protein